MADVFEMLMIVLFGVSWPINCVKLWQARTTKGVSAWFYSLVILGYLFGIGSKVIKLRQGILTPFYVWFFYGLNTVMISACLVIYFRNRRLERSAKRGNL